MVSTVASARVLRTLLLTCAAVGVAVSPLARADASAAVQKIGPLAQQRALLAGRSRVVVQAPSADAQLALAAAAPTTYGATVLRSLPLIHAVVLDLPDPAITALAGDPNVQHVAYDRVIVGSMERTGATIGATAVRQELGVDGSGIGVAVIDSGVTAWHDDLSDSSLTTQRVDTFVDFVNNQTTTYDDYGHGTHVAGIIAGNGYDSSGARSGIAPGVHLTVLKVLDGSGQGHISDVIAALDYVVAHQGELNIRIVNLSVAAGVYDSYTVDPLTLAAREAVNAGIVVVAAAGNNGRGPTGTTQYGGVTAPGNAPWVLTVGASSHMGTVDRSDDTMAAFSSRGPSAVDYNAKPDLVAPGVGIESLSNPNSAMYSSYAPYLLSGTVATSYLPYLSLSGTSMSTPVVAGTVALMLQANPALTPNAVKAILQYTSQVYPAYDPLTEGAGFLNAKGAVELAAYLAAPDVTPYPDTTDWSRHLIWGNHITTGGRFLPDANAWETDVTWGNSATGSGKRIAWGVFDDGTPWQTMCLDAACSTFDGSVAAFPNIVWGNLCSGADCQTPWSVTAVSTEGDTVVWGSNSGEADTVVWGSDSGEGDTVVWGSSCTDPSCQPVLWNKQ
jgi:serine protease AprX